MLNGFITPPPHYNALVIKIKIGSTNMHWVLIDNRSAPNILSYDAYTKIRFLDKDLGKILNQLCGFFRAPIDIKGSIKLPITLSEGLISNTGC